MVYLRLSKAVSGLITHFFFLEKRKPVLKEKIINANSDIQSIEQ